MDNRSTIETVWRAARNRIARLNQILVENDPADEAVFSATPRETSRRLDLERRIVEARKARSRG